MNNFKRTRIIDEILKELDVSFNRTHIIVPVKEFIFKLPFDGNLVNIYLKDCDICQVDCYKKLVTHFPENFKDYANYFFKKMKETASLTEKDAILLSKVAMLKQEPDKILDLVNIKDILTLKIHHVRFVLMGLDGVGKSTIFEYFPGNISEYEPLVDSFIKINETFKPLNLELIVLGNTIVDNIISESIAPLIKNELSNVYMFILITDSTSKNVMKTKLNLLPKVSELNPYALKICIANKQDIPNALNFKTIDNILGIQTYPLVAIDPKLYEEFMKIVWETVLLRIEQMKEHNCPYL